MREQNPILSFGRNAAIAGFVGVLWGLIVPALTEAAVIRGLSKGVIGGIPPKSAPGDPFSFDYRAIASGLPLDIASIRITFSSNVAPTALKLQLSSGELLTVPMLSSTVSIFEWYNPVYIDPSLLTQIPHAPLTSGWWNELSPDGVLNARVWVEGAPTTGSFYSLSAALEASDAPLAPEPSGTAWLCAAAMLTRRRFGRRAVQ